MDCTGIGAGEPSPTNFRVTGDDGAIYPQVHVGQAQGDQPGDMAAKTIGSAKGINSGWIAWAIPMGLTTTMRRSRPPYPRALLAQDAVVVVACLFCAFLGFANPGAMSLMAPIIAAGGVAMIAGVRLGWW